VTAVNLTIPRFSISLKESVFTIVKAIGVICFKAFGDILDGMIKAGGNKLTTGFVGTPYLLHVLTETGHTDTAYTLFLSEEFPSWLYSVKLGATTVWEHWDGLREDGSLWSPDMNSFNHYSYGCVCDWMFEKLAGIGIDEENPGFENVILAPHPDKRLEWARASLDTKYGKVSSEWRINGDSIDYEFTVPNKATLILDGEKRELEKGVYKFTKKATK
jgi:alpha-L-rhamnosidase